MTRISRRGRWAFVAALTGFLLLIAGTIDRLPPTVASHFDWSGAPNGWSSRSAYVGLLLLLGAALPLGTVGLVTLITRRGPALLNLPFREHWLAPAYAPDAVRRSRAHMWWLAAILTATAGALHLAILHAHRSAPPRLQAGSLLLVAGVLLVPLAAWTVAWYRLFRPEAGD